MYTLIALDEKEGRDIKLKRMNDEEYKELTSQLATINSVFASDTKYEMIKRNCSCFLSHYESLTPKDIAPGHADEVFIEINRLFENILNSFYSWIELNQKEFKTIFDVIKTSYFDNNIEYRLAYVLRMYCEHHALSFTEIQWKMDTNELVLDVSSKDLLASGLGNKDIRNDLSDLIAKGENIHLKELVIGLDMLLPKMQRDIIVEVNKSVGAYINGIFSTVGTIRTRFLYVKDDEDKTPIKNLVSPINKYTSMLSKYGVAS